MDNDLIDMIAADNAQADVHDKIKEILYAKSQENINLVTPAVTADMFGGPNPYLDEPETVSGDEPADGTPSSVEDTTEVESPAAEAETPDDEVEEEQPEA